MPARKLDKIFRTAVQYKASDIFITSGSKPALRINGDIVVIQEHTPFTKQMAEEFLLEILNPIQKTIFEKNLDLDFSLEVEGIARFRVNLFVQRKGVGAVFRLIPETVYSFDELGLPQTLKNCIGYKNGLVIVTGPTGSGKSTTMAALINEINDKEAKHIITVEDPIEFIHENKKSIVEQRETGNHTKSFETALRGALRENPDVIMVGEMRDLETIQLAITAAETGHLVFGTLHTSGAAKAVSRIIDVFPTNQQNQIRMQLSETLRSVVWQTLIKTKDKKGRIPAYEIMFANNAIANMIRKEKIFQINSAIETGTREGMQTMKKALMDLLQADLITEEDAMSNIPPEFEA
ncbi:MAG: type IV pilus twitching motility protein PilT [Patescibacteria group bacterium]